MELIIKIILSYLLGSFSGSMILGKFKGVDIREMGSGNAGSTNALRTMGLIFAIGTILIDIFKGYIAVTILPFLKLGNTPIINTIDLETLLVICGIGAIIGHVYPIYYKFRGGKGAGTVIGILIALFPISLSICLPIWLVVLILSGYVGLSTIIAGIVLPICTTIFYTNGLYSPFGFFSIIISLFIIYTHRSNIYRMIAKSEHRFEKIMIFKK